MQTFQIKCVLLRKLLSHPMLKLCLYAHAVAALQVYLLWGLGILVAAFLVALIFRQRRTGDRLRGELAELAKLKQGNIEYEFILKAMRLATWHIDPLQRTLSMDNDFREDQDNYTPPPATNLDVLPSMIAKSDADRVKAAIDDICTGRINTYHQQYRVKSGSVTGLTYWEDSIATIVDRDSEGRPMRIVGTSRRIDDQKNMEAALISARNKAEESDRLKTAFIANMGHEIRTPLNAIVGFSDLLPVVESEEDRNQIIKEIQFNNQKLLRIINGLVSMSKIEAEAKNLVKSQTNLVSVLKDIANVHAATVDTQNVALVTQFPYTELMINTDVNKLRELVDNFMSNAVKFTLKGRITLGYDLPDGEHVRIWVTDTGLGVAEADRQRIFDRFVKVNEYVPGTGLGLSVAKSHAESLGGKIGVDSKLGEGSTFWVELPLI